MAAFLAVCAVVLLIHQLRICCEMDRWAKEMEETDGCSNLRLTTSLPGKSAKRLCRALNGRLDEGQSARLSAQRSERELKAAIASISHDIRTPLAGAGGYLELLSGVRDQEKREQYWTVIHRKLKELETLLDELFLYTKVTQEEYLPDLVMLQPCSVLAEVLADFFDQMEEAGIEPDILLQDESWTVRGDEDSLRRIFTNLIKNMLEHGVGSVKILQEGDRICFQNRMKEGDNIDIDRVFDPFYKADSARHVKSSGLGLFIVRQLMEKLGGFVEAEVSDGRLRITLTIL